MYFYVSLPDFRLQVFFFYVSIADNFSVNAFALFNKITIFKF